ncbi:13394_t:CDS:1 [Dentiscutata erythropus]|uniref:13394_t:CDS:1 n=1 Tax=Dentiscutata erythropus TaxID=1348616 RepID=A0A9N9JGK6_9GLOM|nr:13394_t:CDS:1 [Dentiscutata erythropus]
MNRSTNPIINVQSQSNNGQLQSPQNIGGPRNANGQLQRTTNIGMLPIRPQNTANLFTGTYTSVQQYADLINGTDPFTRTQGVENLPPQSIRFSTLLFSGVSFS